jgi:hypothetical protein
MTSFSHKPFRLIHFTDKKKLNTPCSTTKLNTHCPPNTNSHKLLHQITTNKPAHIPISNDQRCWSAITKQPHKNNTSHACKSTHSAQPDTQWSQSYTPTQTSIDQIHTCKNTKIPTHVTIQPTHAPLHAYQKKQPAADTICMLHSTSYSKQIDAQNSIEHHIGKIDSATWV